MDKKIGLFYGTDTGNTELVSNRIVEIVDELIGKNNIDIHEIYQKTASDMEKYTCIIMGQPTWYDGELQGDWEEFIPELKKIDFNNKKVALFGLGDQYGYASYFCDSIGIYAEMLSKLGAKIVGYTKTDGYEHDFSKAEKDGTFCGLCLDIDNQDELTENRLQKWLPHILKSFEYI